MPVDSGNGKETFRFLRWEFDVDKFRSLLKGRPNNFTLWQGKASLWAAHNAFIAIDREHVAKLSPRDLGDPLFAVERDEGVLLIDGHHRLARKIEQDQDVEIWIMPKRLVHLVAKEVL